MDSELIRSFAEILGPQAILTGADAALRLDGGPHGCASVLLRPQNTAEVAAILSLCHRHRQPMVPVGGRTGLVQGAYAAAGEVALSLDRMTEIEEVDPINRTMTVQAGVPLQTAQEAAEEAGMFLALDIGARGSATIGGNVSTNAGGNRVMRFGSMRNMVLGLEVVLANGTVIENMDKIRKNNTGYDLKQIFIGSEGTLGVVTRVVLSLFPRPTSESTALLSLNSFGAVLDLLTLLQERLGPGLSSFEVMWRNFYHLVTTPPAPGTAIVSRGEPYYVLCEGLGFDPQRDDEIFMEALVEAQERGLLVEAAFARSQAQRDAMWALREDVQQPYRNGWAALYDVSLPLDAMESYVHDLGEKLQAWRLDHRLFVFGHIADGNLHLVVSMDDPNDEDTLHEMVYGALPATGSSISAEHGIGSSKQKYLSYTRSEAEISLMRTLKSALDPLCILNPGKVLPVVE